MSIEEFKIFADYHKFARERVENEMEYSEIVLRAVRENLGEQIHKDVHEIIGACEVDGTGIVFCRKPVGDWEEYKTQSFDGYWVDQSAHGDSGDSWEGNIYVKLKKGLYLKMPFTC